MRLQSSNENDIWDKICEVKSIGGSQNGDFIPNLERNIKEKNPYIYSMDSHSMLSDIDHHKEHFVDNMSIGSHKKLNEMSGFPNLQSHNFDLTSQPSNKGFSEVKSVCETPFLSSSKSPLYSH